MKRDDFVRNAIVRKVVDGDTIEVDIDLGFHVRGVHRLRLAGINTPEIRGPERPFGLQSKAYVEELLPVGTEVAMRSQKDGKYHNRYIADLWLDVGGKEVHINTHLVERGLAHYKEY